MKTQTQTKVTALVLAMSLALPVGAADHHDHVHGDLEVKGKPASEHTIAANKVLSERLNWQDRDAFERNEKGLIVPLDAKTANIMRNSYDTN
ncbi:hypothetical protein [Endozoicomonas atrinae]|uniref:hypothetical protein n=1 Tax=Endozoicomonas atrinae TaxID=1333660 RepID=UPI000824A27D|nr:hypothetical protein [Endozoicomonas atrinae]